MSFYVLIHLPVFLFSSSVSAFYAIIFFFCFIHSNVCFTSFRSRTGSIPTWIIRVPVSSQVMAYMIFFPSEVFGVTS